MALSKPALAALIKAELISEFSSAFSGQKTDLLAPEQAGIDTAWDGSAGAIANAVANNVIDHFESSAEVVVTDVQPGGGTAPGTIT